MKVSFVLAVVLVAASAGAGWPAAANAWSTADMQGTWVLTDIDGQPVAAGAALSDTIHFTLRDDEISGFDGCNSFQGSVAAPGRIISTQRGCPPERPMLPLDLADPALQLSQARVDGDMLHLPLRAGDDGSARFVRRRR